MVYVSKTFVKRVGAPSDAYDPCQQPQAGEWWDLESAWTGLVDDVDTGGEG